MVTLTNSNEHTIILIIQCVVVYGLDDLTNINKPLNNKLAITVKIGI